MNFKDRKRWKTEDKSKNRGITLIALVVTIIVLIILAGISINLVLGENGIIQKAKQSKVAQTEAEVKEKVEMILAEYAMEKEFNNKTLLSFLQEKKSSQEIDEVTDNGDGTYTIIIDGYMVTINENKLSIEQIEEETQFRKDAKGKARFVCVPETGYVSSVQASIQIDDSVKMYTIQYNMVDNDKESLNWITYIPETSFNVSDNITIYGRIINEETNEIGYNFRKEISNIDEEKPENAIIEFDITSVNINETIQATIIQEDNKSGIDIDNCKYIVNDSETEIGIDSTSWDSALAFTQTPETINITKTVVGTYYLHVLSVDEIGNKIETISDGIKFKGAIYYLNTNKFGVSNDMPGWNVVDTTNSSRLQTSSKAYVVTTNKYNFDEINKLTSNIKFSTNSSGVKGTVILGLVSNPSSEEFEISNSISYSWNSYPSKIELDVSNIKGEYYIKILYTTNNSGGNVYSSAGGTVIGE